MAESDSEYVEPQDLPTLLQRLEAAQQELSANQAQEHRTNLAILLKDKELHRLRSRLQDLEDQINLNKASYATENTFPALLHPLVNGEFKVIRDQLRECTDKLTLVNNDKLNKRLSEQVAASKDRGSIQKYFDKEISATQKETSESRVKGLKEDLDREKAHTAEMERRLVRQRELADYLVGEIDELQNIMSTVLAQTQTVETQYSALASENERLGTASR